MSKASELYELAIEGRKRMQDELIRAAAAEYSMIMDLLVEAAENGEMSCELTLEHANITIPRLRQDGFSVTETSDDDDVRVSWEHFHQAEKGSDQ